MISEFVFVFATPALQVDIEKYAIYELFEMGIQVSILDISPMVEPEVNKAVTAKRIDDTRANIYICNRKDDLEKIIKTKSNETVFLPMFDCYYNVRFFYMLMTKYKKIYGYINNASGDVAPIINESHGRLSLIERISLNGNLFFYIKGAIFNRGIRRILIRNKASFTVLAGSEREQQFLTQGECGSSTKILRLHSFDFERFKNTSGYNNHSRDYGVFLDIYLPYHADTGKIGYQVNADIYYSEINSILDSISKKYNMEILIAAHPRSDYSGQRAKYYKKYKIEYGITAALVKNAKLVISHYSTSTAFAVMANKPVIIVNSAVFDNYKIWNQMNKTYAQLLDAVIVRDATDIDILNRFPEANSSAYESFKMKYIGKSKDEEKSIWQNIMNELSI